MSVHEFIADNLLAFGLLFVLIGYVLMRFITVLIVWLDRDRMP